MSDEIRAAAERLRRDDYHYEDCATMWNFSYQRSSDICALADAYLAANPADGDEPVTEEWMHETYGPPPQYKGTWAWPGAPVVIRFDPHIDNRVRALTWSGDFLRVIESKAQLRNLLAALGGGVMDTLNIPAIREAAAAFHWTGDLDDDCTCLWNGMMLRAEAMGERWWWWAVYKDREKIASSNDVGGWTCGKNGNIARRFAEHAALKHCNTTLAADVARLCDRVEELERMLKEKA